MDPAVQELVEDYAASLQDLTQNSRYEITNLTVIARENVHAAQGIARTIEAHIKNTSPPRKLPALYLMDSIAKNVGSPYTIFFQQKLYNTFMDAYAVVDPPIRKKLEEMLKTWKEPVQGSTSTKPVFDLNVTRRIETALIKAKTVVIQQQQKMGKKDPLGAQRQAGRTPPIMNGSGAYVNEHGLEQMRTGSAPPSNGHTSVMKPSTPLGIRHPYQPPMSLTPQVGGNVDTLHSDLERLIESSTKELVADQYNQEVQKKLDALLNLKALLDQGQVAEAELPAVREQIRSMANTTTNTPPRPPPPQPVMPQFSTQDLAALLATTLPNFTQPMAPPLPMPSMTGVSLTNFPPPPASAPPMIGSDAASLFMSLQQAGLLPGSAQQGAMQPTPPPPPPPQAASAGGGYDWAGLDNLMKTSQLPPQPQMRSSRNPQNKWRSIDVEMKSQSLKNPRPHLIHMLNDTLPNKCSSCAKRFSLTESGKKDKAAHLDWHFRVNLRLTENKSRGQIQNRSWYVGEEEWIKTKDTSEDTAQSLDNSGPIDLEAQERSKNEDIRKQYVVVPDSGNTQAVCPICQEELQYVWHHETDEWVWMDAKRVGERIYHASCHAEATKDRAANSTVDLAARNSREGTPASMKRKAEAEEMDPRKVRKEKA